MTLFILAALSDSATVIPAASIKIPVTAANAALDCITLLKVSDYWAFICLGVEILGD
jgi:hypothetical protein